MSFDHFRNFLLKEQSHVSAGADRGGIGNQIPVLLKIQHSRLGKFAIIADRLVVVSKYP